MSLQTYFKEFNKAIKMDYDVKSELKEKRDILLSLWMIILFGVVISRWAAGDLYTYYYPFVRTKGQIMVYVAYILLCVTPMAVNILEGIRWRRLKSKI